MVLLKVGISQGIPSSSDRVGALLFLFPGQGATLSRRESDPKPSHCVEANKPDPNFFNF